MNDPNDTFEKIHSIPFSLDDDSKLCLLAGLAMQGVLTRTSIPRDKVSEVSCGCINTAEALLAELKKREKRDGN